MANILIFTISVLGLVGILMLTMELGRRWGVRRNAKSPETPDTGLSAVDGAVYGLLALMISFTFAGAAGRFDMRRELIVQETNAIGTAYLRVSLLPSEMQEPVRRDFRDYVDARLAFYRYFASSESEKRSADERVQGLQQKIWNESVEGCRAIQSPAATTLILSSLNEMIDITTTRQMAAEMHPPVAVYIALCVIALTGTLLAGYGTGGAKQRSWLHTFIFAGVLGMALYTILDLEYPRIGLIRIDATDHVLVDQRNRM